MAEGNDESRSEPALPPVSYTRRSKPPDASLDQVAVVDLEKGQALLLKERITQIGAATGAARPRSCPGVPRSPNCPWETDRG